MNKRAVLFTAAAVALLIAGLAAGIALRPRLDVARSGQAPAMAEEGVQYYCPMHPTIVSDRPGECPICQMRLVPRREHAAEVGHGAEIAAAAGPAVEGRASVRIAADRQQLIGVRTAPVTRGPLVRTIRTVARITYDETRLHHVHTKVGGWIERLHADATGDLVREGQPLLTIYSPELLASQEEYLLALRARDRLSGATLPSLGQSGEELVASARRRLRLFDLTEEQIAELERTGRASRTITLSSPMTGHIVARNVAHGEKIESGTTLLDIADLSRIWAVADIYEYELPFVRQGQPATLTLSYSPGQSFKGRIGLVYPFLSGTTRTVKVRLEFPNPDLTLKPEMFGDVELQANLREGLLVPDSAVISTGERDIAFVDLGGGLFEPRELRLGVRLTDGVEVIEGLAEGERIVTSGNFLVDSESRLKAALAGAVARPTSTPPPSQAPAGHVH